MIGDRWGVTQAEVERSYGCDAFVTSPTLEAWRGVTVRADPDTVWARLRQVRIAPYSYDLVDNLGRRSPRTLTPGADRLEVGQTMAMVFRLTGFDDGHHWTAVTGERGRRLLGTTSMTYAAEPVGSDRPDHSRLVCRMVTTWPRPASDALAWGDLVMMRKQLHTLRDLAEGRLT